MIVIIVTISGFCSLVYQVAWDRIIRYNFGGDSVSSAIVTSTFLLGLGIGAYLFKRYKSRAVGIYANVELGIGLFGIVSYFVLSNLAVFFGQFLNPGNASVDSFKVILIIICFLFILPPCILMGGTLPLMFNSFIDPEQYDSKKIGLFYGFNTFGASLGILSVPLFFFNNFDLPTTLFFVGGLNITLSFVIRFLGKPFSCQKNVQEESDLSFSAIKGKSPLTFILFLSIISGMITLAMEITLFRMAAVWWPSSPYNFPGILMPLLLALSAGSFIFAQTEKSEPDSYYVRLSLLFLLSSLGILWTVFFRSYFQGLDSYQKYFLLYAVIVFPYAVFQGGIFPILLKIASPYARQLPNNTGIIYLANSIGAFSGGVIFQFIVFPYLGTKVAILLLMYAGLAVSVLVLWKTANLKEKVWTKSNRPVVIVALALLLLLPFTVKKNRWNIFIYGMTNPFFESIEGVTGVATIEWDKNKTGGGVYVNGQYMSALPDHPKHVRLAVYPLSWPNREKVLVLGLGGGGMVRELARDDQIKKIDVVDWSYELPRILSSPNAGLLLNQALSNPKVSLFPTDARVAVTLFESKRYDVIIDNLAITSWIGSTSIKSEKYFKEVSRILKNDGVYILDINADSSKGYRGVLAGLVRNFNFVQTHYDAIAISSNKNIHFDLKVAPQVLEARKNELKISPPYLDWLLNGMKKFSKSDFLIIDPIRDEWLVNEYFLWPNKKLYGFSLLSRH